MKTFLTLPPILAVLFAPDWLTRFEDWTTNTATRPAVVGFAVMFTLFAVSAPFARRQRASVYAFGVLAAAQAVYYWFQAGRLYGWWERNPHVLTVIIWANIIALLALYVLFTRRFIFGKEDRSS